MKKKVLLVVISIIGVLGLYFIISPSEEERYLDNLEQYYKISNDISQLFEGSEFKYSRYSDVLLPEATKDIKEYVKELKGTDDYSFNITDYAGEPQQVDIEVGGSYLPEEKEEYLKGLKEYLKTYKPEEIYDPRLFKKDGEYFIKTKDIVYDFDNSDLIAYGERYIEIKKEDVPKNYTYMLNSSDFSFLYNSQNTIQQSDKTYKMLFKYSSATGGKPLIITMYIKKGLVQNIEVNKVWER